MLNIYYRMYLDIALFVELEKRFNSSPSQGDIHGFKSRTRYQDSCGLYNTLNPRDVVMQWTMKIATLLQPSIISYSFLYCTIITIYYIG